MKTFLVLLSFGLALSEDVKPTVLRSNTTSDVGEWKVGNCLMAGFALQINIGADNNATTQTSFVVPENAAVNADQAQCGNATNTLELSWSETAPNDTSLTLARKLDITFKKAINSTAYGVAKIVAEFEVNRIRVNETTVVVRTLELVRGGDLALIFKTPLDRSFLCANIDTVHLNGTLREDGRFVKTIGNANMTAEHVTFDAFRPSKNVPSGYRTPMDCDYKPNDIIPIAVGVALAGLVVAVLVAYIVGRRRNMARGYQSV